MMRVFRWRPLGWEEKEVSTAVSFSTAAESFDSNPPPGVFKVTAPSFTDSSVDLGCEEEETAEDLSQEGQVKEDQSVSLDPWVELAAKEERPRDTQGKGLQRVEPQRVQWADDSPGIPASWASFPSFTLPVSYGCETVQKKTVRFADPLTEDLSAVKRTRGGKWRKVLERVKAKLVCGAPHL